MQLLFTAVIGLFATSCVLNGYLAEEHLVPKHGLAPKHGSAKLSQADIEVVLKALLSKLEHKTAEADSVHKKDGDMKRFHPYAPEKEKIPYHEAKDELGYGEKSHSVIYGYAKGAHPHDYEMKKDAAIGGKDIEDFSMKLKELGIGKDSEDSYKTELSHEAAEDKYLSEEVHLSKDSKLLEKSGKVLEDAVKDKFSDKDVSIAESLYHMKIAGDAETYPHIKMAPLFNAKIADEKLHEEKAGDEESYLKKVDEIGKTLMKEEHLKEGGIEIYLKKVAEGEKPIHYEPKIAHSEIDLKTAEEKAIEAWKAGHQDLFVAEGEFFDGKFLKTGAPHSVEEGIAHEMNDELIKKLKELGLDKGLDEKFLKEGALHVEEGITHEMNDEFIKKLKELGLDKGLDEKFLKEGGHHVEEGIAHGMKDEYIKHLKDLGVDKELDKKYLTEGGHHVEEGIAHGMNDEFIKKLKELGLELDKEIGVKFLKEGTHYVEEGVAHEVNDEYIKKLKSLGLDKELDSKFLKEGVYYVEEGAAHELNDEFIKKLKSLGLDKELSKENAKFPHILPGEFHKEGEIVQRSVAYDKAKEQAHKDAHVHLSEEEIKKYLDEALALAAKEKGLGTDLHFEKGLPKEKFHGYDTKVGAGFDKSLHGILGEEAFKSKDAHGWNKAYEFETEKAKFNGKIPVIEGEFKYGIGHGITDEFAAEAGKAFKVHDEDILKKEKAFGTDAFLHKAHEDELWKKGKVYGTDEFLHKVHEDELLKKDKAYGLDASLHIAHDDEQGKKDISFGTDVFLYKDKDVVKAADEHHVQHGKSHKGLHDLKSKFFELLKRVLGSRKCYLVSMRPGELLGIVNCVSRSKDPILCEKFAMCEKKMPPRVLAALEKCQKETVPGEIKKCTRFAPLYPSSEIPVKIFQCVALSTRELIPEEQKKMIEFEECARIVKAESCGRFKFFPR